MNGKLLQDTQQRSGLLSIAYGSRLRTRCLWLASTLLLAHGSTWAFDPLRTGGAIPMTVADGLITSSSGGSVCVFDSVTDPLPLEEAVERALCNNPKTREAWAQVKIRAAQVGEGRGAYLPTITGNWQGVRDDTVTNVTNYPQYSSDYRNSVLRTESVSLSWVLYDFGGRKAALANANALLAAAQASQEAALETAFGNVAKDYYAAQAAQGAFDAADDIEATAKETLKAATARADKGVAPISDELQAETSWAQAVVNKTKAHGDWQTAVGTLNADMGLDANSGVTLPPVTSGVAPGPEFSQSVADLIQEAKASHPSVVSAERQLDAAVDKVKQTRAEGLPKLELVAKYSYNNQPTTLAVGIPQFPATGHEWYLGFQLTIPLFEGFVRTYQIREAEAQVELQQDTVLEAQQQVGLDVWTSYQSLQTFTQNLDNSQSLLDIAQRSYAVAQQRYQKGVGNMLELLNAQSSLAGAKRQRIQALTDWRAARLQLAAKLGKLGMWGLTRR